MNIRRLLDRVVRYGTGITALRPDDILLVSYPKSGNTWVRFFFANLLSLEERQGEEVDFETVDRTMPELASDDLRQPWPFKILPRIVKTHNPFWFPFRGKRAIYIVRDPRDVMVSHFFFVTGKVQSPFQGDFQAFLRHPKFGLENWFRHVRSWEGKASVFVRYEDLLTDDLGQFRNILAALKVDLPEERLVKIVEASRFDNLKKKVEQSGHSHRGGFKEGFNFMRKGKSKDWVEHFTEDDLALFRRLCAQYGNQMYG